jgi:DNA-binding NtrC family response regulator
MNRRIHNIAEDGMIEGPGDGSAGVVSPPPDNGSTTVLLGQSPPMLEVKSAIEMVADTDTAVFISGESGTGKEVVARLIHEGSRRKRAPFVALNCAALPREVIENELFGHEREAFTGAASRKTGCFELADGGTMLFDEIAEMPADTQAKLLRAIETKSFRRLGGQEEVKVDVRILAATNRDIPTALRLRELREDLYYRFSIIEIALPPLRDRREDIPALVAFFLEEHRGKHGRPEMTLTDEAMDLILGYDWPGNVRELKNLVERCVVIARDGVIGADALPAKFGSRPTVDRTIVIPFGTPFAEAEKKIIRETLAAVGNNKSEAARILMISRRGLQKMIRRHESNRRPAIGGWS